MSVGAIRAGRAMVEIFADSSMLARGLASAQSKMARFAQTIRRLGTTQVVLGVGMAAPIAAAVRQYAMLEQRINTVRSLTGATVAQMRGLTQAIRQIGMETGRPFNEIADGMGELSRAGVRLQSLGKATRVIADFSRAAGVDMSRAANIGVEVLTQFGLSMEHLPRVADVLQEMANATVSTVEDLSDGFRYAGQTAKTFGLTLEQAGSAIAYLQQSGLSSTTAGTALNQMLLQMVQNLDKVEAAVGGLRGANGEFLPFADILGKLQQHIVNMPGPERLQWLNEMFDVRGMRGAEALLKDVEAWMLLTAQAEGSMGASKRKATEMSRAFIVSFEKMRNGLVDFSYAVGEVLDSDLRSAFGTLANLASGLGPFIKANGEAVRSVAKFAAVLTVSGATFFTVGVSLQLLAFSFEGFVKASLAAYAPINGLIGLGKMLGVAFASTASQVTRAGAAITAAVVGLHAAVTRPVDASIAAVTAFGTSFVSMHRTVSGAVARTVATMRTLAAAGFAARGAAAAAPQAVGAAAAGAAAATAGAGRAAAAPVAAAAAAQAAVAARGPLPMIAPAGPRQTRLRRRTRLPRGPFGQMAPAGPRMEWYVPPGADPITGAQLMTRRRRNRAAGREFRTRPENVLADLRSRQPTARQARIAELLAANRARLAAEAGVERRRRIRELAVANNVRRMAENVAPRVPRSQLFTQSDDFVRGLNPFQRAAARFNRSRGVIPRLARGMMTGFGRQTIARGMAAGFGRQSLVAARGLGIGAAAMAVPALKLAAAIGAAAAAASLLRSAFGGIVPLARDLGGRLAKLFDGFASRAREVWPEIQQTVKTGWRGVMDAINAGDLSLAWKVFADTAKATFAQIMVIIGPFVDGVSEILGDIGDGLYQGIKWAVSAGGDLFSGLLDVARPVGSYLAGIGDMMFRGVADASGGVGDLLSSLGGHAEEAGNRIYEALSAGDIVAAWSAAVAAIRKMFVELGSWWEQSVAAPMRLVGEEFGGRQMRSEMLRRHNAEFGRDFTAVTSRLSMLPRTEEELAAAERDALATSGGDERRDAAIREAANFRKAQLRAAGAMSPERRNEDRQKQLDAVEADFRRKEEERESRRQENARRRREEADRASAKAAGGASTAAELRARKEMERRIGEATTQEELDKIQRELDGKTAKTDGDEGAARVLRGGKTEQEFAALKSKIEARREGRVAEMQKEGEAFGLSQNEIDANIAAKERHAARISASSNMVEIDRSGADYLDELAGIMERFRGSGAKDEQGQTGDELRKRAQDLRNEADVMIRDAQQRFQDPANKTRAKEAENLRVQAAAQRRGGDEQAAAKLEESAAALEQAVDAMEAAEMQKQINEARQAIANEQALRGQQAAAGGEAAAAAAKQLDAVGGFMSSAFERMGYGSNLGERQAKAAEEAARGINKLVGIVERSGGVFV